VQKHLLKILSLSQVFCFISAQTTIAVIDFDARGISADEVATLTDRFRDELTKTNKYTVIERGKMEEVLKEQGFQQSGCASDECVVEVGQLIGVQQMVGGSIGKVGDVFTLSVRIIDVESGTILNVTNYDHFGDLGGLLTVGMHKAVQQLLDSKLLHDIEKIKSNGYTTTTASTQANTITDIDENIYKTVKIGNQWWMAENLKVTRYRNGDAIPNVTKGSDWLSLSTGAYCNYDNDGANAAIYGGLYNWYAVSDSRNIAPEGWHVPTDDEWKELEMYLGMSQSEADQIGWRGTDEGDKLKETGNTHWYIPNIGATNESGYTGLPGGYRYIGGNFYGLGYYAYFWSSTGGSLSNDAWFRLLNYYYSGVFRNGNDKRYGFSIRCVRD